MIPPPDVLSLSVYWAKLFHPWMWHRANHTWTDKAKHHPLLACNQEQLAYALQMGWTPESISAKLTDAKRTGADGHHVYLLLSGRRPCGKAWDSVELLTGVEVWHPKLFLRTGMILGSFTANDLLRYATGVCPATAFARVAFEILIQEHGLDLVLYAIDAARDDGASLRTPWGLTAFLGQAQRMLADRKAILAYARWDLQQQECAPHATA